MARLAVAALSARVLAEAAQADGFEVLAFDLFGDADTRRAASHWSAIGDSAELRIDGARLLQSLRHLACRGDVAGWIAGSGFEACTDLLEHGARLLPLIGTVPANVRRVRDPQAFFVVLAAHGIAHPEVRRTLAPATPGWLLKDAQACGGWHIRHAAPGECAPGPWQYFQREMPGAPMSATFVANGEAATVLGFNRQIVRPLAGRPHVYRGVIGPVPVPAAVRATIERALSHLVPAFGLRGLGSLDFLLDDEAQPWVLEVNPRPPASMALYGPGTVAAHVRACVEGRLPPAHPEIPAPAHGTEIVFAPCALRLDEAAARRLRQRADCHDLPGGAMECGAGEPLCSVSAQGSDAQHVLASLARARQSLLHSLECAT